MVKMKYSRQKQKTVGDVSPGATPGAVPKVSPNARREWLLGARLGGEVPIAINTLGEGQPPSYLTELTLVPEKVCLFRQPRSPSNQVAREISVSPISKPRLSNHKIEERLVMASDIRETPFVKQLAANGTLLGRFFYYQIVWNLLCNSHHYHPV